MTENAIDDTGISINSFIFYRSFKEAIDELADSEKLLLYDAISSYGLDKVEPKLPKGAVRAIFFGIKAQLDANFRKRENAKKGGAPKGNKNATKKVKDE